jgi:Tol biopolymer transport system component
MAGGHHRFAPRRARLAAAWAVVALGVCLPASAMPSGVRAATTLLLPRPVATPRLLGGGIVFASDRTLARNGDLYLLGSGLAPRALTHDPITDTAVAVAPTGRLVAFWSDRSGSWQLYLARPDGTAVRRVGGSVATSPTTPDNLPVFSASGATLLVPRPTSSAPAAEQTLIVDVRTGAAHRVAAACWFGFGFAPDGRVVTCQTDPSGPSRLLLFDTTGRVRARFACHQADWSATSRFAVDCGSSTLVVSESGRILRRVAGSFATTTGAPMITPDANRLLVVRRGVLTLVNATTGRVARRVGRSVNGRFTPDGRYIDYTNPRGVDLLVPVAGGRAVSLPDGPTHGGFNLPGVWTSRGQYVFTALPTVSWTAVVEIGDRYGRHARVIGAFPYDDHGSSALLPVPRSSRLVYSFSVRDHANLWVVHADGSALARLTTSTSDQTAPAWSADGSRLAFSTAPFAGTLCGFCEYSIALATPAGQITSMIPPTSEIEDGQPSWSPDATHLAVVLTVTGGIDVVSTTGTSRTTLVTGSYPHSPAWSPDATRIAYINDAGRLELISPLGGPSTPFVPATSATSVAWSPSGTQLVYTTAAGVWVVNATGGAKARRVATVTAPASPTFSPDAAQIAFSATVGVGALRHSAIFVAAADGSALRMVTTSLFNDTTPAWQP